MNANGVLKKILGALPENEELTARVHDSSLVEFLKEMRGTNEDQKRRKMGKKDMIMCYGEARSNSYEAQRIYRERYPLRQVPNVRTFIDVHRRLREDGCFRKPKLNSGVSGTRRTVRNEEIIQEQAPEKQVQRMSGCSKRSHFLVTLALNKQLKHKICTQYMNKRKRSYSDMQPDGDYVPDNEAESSDSDYHNPTDDSLNNELIHSADAEVNPLSKSPNEKLSIRNFINETLEELLETSIALAQRKTYTKKGTIRKLKLYDVPLSERKKTKIIQNDSGSHN
ncbi:helix-turn-helix domain [Holotrichia oblita]|uniref:Helix-turn-helix domain n=1 Tax=Holotrichia oblita TaxID=644536 RepID=A0ACB9TIV0_HOLOL|nr:helix-turn-helix domain [Holotrichia oblita]